jgi:hypothetical protein
MGLDKLSPLHSMTTDLLFLAWVFLSLFSLGAIAARQLQYLPLYRFIGGEVFSEHLKQNDRVGMLPSILPILVLLPVSLALLVIRPAFLPFSAAMTAVLLNVVVYFVSIVWQAGIQRQLERQGYDEALLRKMISTGWVRLIALSIQAAQSLAFVYIGMKR